MSNFQMTAKIIYKQNLLQLHINRKFEPVSTLDMTHIAT